MTSSSSRSCRLPPAYRKLGLNQRRRFDPSGKTPASRENPSTLHLKNIPLYRNSELRYPSAIPVLEEGRSSVVTNVGRGAVDVTASGTRRGPGRDEPREVLAGVRTNGASNPAKPLGEAGSLRTAKPCGPGRRCYGQALRRWIGALPGLGPSSIRKVTVTKGNSSPGRAGISRQPTAQGRPSVRLHLYAAVRFPLRYTRTVDRGCQPAPGLPCALFTEEGHGKEQDSGISCRENADACSEDEMVLPDRIELSTSPLPMECSTTELRQHVLGQESAATRAYQAGRYLPQASPLCKLASPAKSIKSALLRAEIGRFVPKPPILARFGSRKIPSQSGSWPSQRIRSNLAASLSRPASHPLEL